MTPVQISYFKHYMFDSGVIKMYLYGYRHHRVKGNPDGTDANPESIEQFLREQPHWRVIMHAFYFEMNSQYGYEFWKDIDKKWQKYLSIHQDNIANSKYATLRGSFSILRQNWDKPEYWKIESVEETYKRLGIEPPEELAPIPVKVESEYISDPNDPELPWNQEKTQEENKPSLLEGFSAVETSNVVGKKMPSNTVSVNLRNGGYRLTFCVQVSDKLREHDYSHAQLFTKKDSLEVALRFNYSDGCLTGLKQGTGKTKNIVINSKELVEHLHSFYELGPGVDYFTLEVVQSEVADDSTVVILKLKR